VTPGILDRYIGRRILTSTLLVFSVLLAMFVFFALLDALPDYGVGNFGLYELLRYVVLSQPRKIYQLFPVATLIGTLIGLSALALTSELVAIRAAGVSVRRIAVAALKTALALIVVAVLLGEFVMPFSDNEAQLGRAQALATGLQKRGSGLWLRDGDSFVNIGEVLPDLSLLRVTVFRLDGQFHLNERLYADSAQFRHDHWTLDGARSSRFDGTRLSFGRPESNTWETRLTPEMVNMFAVQPEMLSIWQLTRYIDHLRSNGLETGQFSLIMWQKLLLPLAMVVMVLIAVPFAMGNARSGGMGARVFLGIMLGLGFEVLHYSFGYAALLYSVPPALGAILPIAVFLTLALYLMRHRTI
jgi:lipopolysaccharide export system permease protein